MRAGIVVLGFSLSLLAAGALADKVAFAHREAAPAPAPLRLVWIDVDRIAERTREAAFAESAAVMERAGVPVEWESSSGGQRPIREGEILVVILPAPPPSLRPSVLGAAQPGADGLRAVWIYVSTVKSALGLRPDDGLLRPRDVQRVGRALARVIVHEVVHVTAPDRAHSAAGLMAARLSRGTLEDPGLTLEGELLPVLRRASTAPQAPTVATGTTVAALAPLITD